MLLQVCASIHDIIRCFLICNRTRIGFQLKQATRQAGPWQAGAGRARAPHKTFEPHQRF